jgi:hypothetical protein
LNNAEVQAGIGAMVNYTESNPTVQKAFLQTGDYERGSEISQISYLLSLGVRVALLYGDRDYVCNWLGGEAVSFSIAAQSPLYSPFYSAGYADIVSTAHMLAVLSDNMAIYLSRGSTTLAISSQLINPKLLSLSSQELSWGLTSLPASRWT